MSYCAVVQKAESWSVVMLTASQEPEQPPPKNLQVVPGPGVGLGDLEVAGAGTREHEWLTGGEEGSPGWGSWIPRKSPAFKPKPK